jgi:hypothetical protein
MYVEHLVETVQNIFDNYFYKLFFHWSWQVRNIFYYFLIYIINYRIKKITQIKVQSSPKLTSHNENYVEQVIIFLTIAKKPISQWFKRKNESY